MTWFTTSDQSNWRVDNGMKIISKLIATAAAIGAAGAATTLAAPAYAATTMASRNVSASSLGPGANASNGEIVIGTN